MENESKYALSVILPCYNVAQYIERAMGSIFRQDFKDYEVIIVNDGSPDNLLEVCRQWEHLPNIRIITTVNQGLSQARNEGLEVAQGEYVYFFDPDDYINEGMFSAVIRKAHEGNYDAVHFGFKTIYEDQGGINYDKSEIPRVYSSNEDIICNYLPKFIGFGQEDIDHWKEGHIWDRNEFAAVWRFIYKRSVLMGHHIRFRKGITLFEDRLFDTFFFLYASSVATMSEVFYNYIIKEKGLLTGSLNDYNKLTRDKINGVTERGLLRNMYIKEKNVDIFYMYIGTIILSALELVVRGAKSPIWTCYKNVAMYLKCPDVKLAFRTARLEGFSYKIRIPALMIKYQLTLFLIALVHLASRAGIELNAD